MSPLFPSCVSLAVILWGLFSRDPGVLGWPLLLLRRHSVLFKPPFFGADDLVVLLSRGPLRHDGKASVVQDV